MCSLICWVLLQFGHQLLSLSEQIQGVGWRLVKHNCVMMRTPKIQVGLLTIKINRTKIWPRPVKLMPPTGANCENPDVKDIESTSPVWFLNE
jgi:hypothetical protein